MKRTLSIILLSLVCTSLFLRAEGVPPLINYQGNIKDGSGDPLATGFHDINFRIYNTASAAEGGTLLWSRQYNLYVMSGRFNVILGQGGSPIAGDSPAMAEIMDAFAAYNGDAGWPRYLALSIDDGVDFSPRQQLLSAPYAARSDSARFADAALYASNAANATLATTATRALQADSASVATLATQAENADKLGNHTADYYARSEQLPAAATTDASQALFWNTSAKGQLAPLYSNGDTIGVGAPPPTNRPDIGLAIQSGALRPLKGFGHDKGIVFESDLTAYRIMQYRDSSNKESLHITAEGSAPSDIVLKPHYDGKVYVDGTLTAKKTAIMKHGTKHLFDVHGQGNSLSYTALSDGFIFMHVSKDFNYDIVAKIRYEASGLEVTLNLSAAQFGGSLNAPVAKGETVSVGSYNRNAGAIDIAVNWKGMGSDSD